MTESVNVSDETILTALMTTTSKTDAAKVAGVSRQTVYNRLHDESFSRELERRRGEYAKAVSQHLRTASVAAIDYLTDVITGSATDGGFFADQPSISERIKAAEILIRGIE